MADEKRVGFFRRLLGGFGRKKKQDPEPEAQDPTPAPQPVQREPEKSSTRTGPPAKKQVAPEKPARPVTAPPAKKPKTPAKKKTPPAKPEKTASTPVKSKPVEKPAKKTAAEPAAPAAAKPAPKPKKQCAPKPAAAPRRKPATKSAGKSAIISAPEPVEAPRAPKPTPKPTAKPADTPAEEPADAAPRATETREPAAPDTQQIETLAEPIPEPTPTAALPVTAPEPAPQKKGWFQRLRDGLNKSSNALTERISSVLTKRRLDAETLQELEDILIQADLGVDIAVRITDALSKDRFNKEISSEEVRAFLAAEVEEVLKPVAQPLVIDSQTKPFVVLVVGVNGTGKTTTIGKLAAQFGHDGHSVLLAAGDTFRAAAIDQLKIWGERAGAPVVAGEVGADAASLAFDAYDRACADASDVLMIDTAGRLQNKADLMAELEKVIRVLKKRDDTAPHAVLLVLDATTGQNALNQVEIFQDVAGVTGLIVTKLDGTARGGILVAIAERFKIPVHAIGVGETLEDMQPFDATDFAAAIVGSTDNQEEAA